MQRHLIAAAALIVCGASSPFAQGTPPRWKSTVEMTIGGANADENSEFARRPREADVFDDKGKLVATAEWPRNIGITNDYRSIILGNTVYAIATDADDLESVVRLRFK